MMETEATVVDEHAPEVKPFRDHIVQWISDVGSEGTYAFTDAEDAEKYAEIRKREHYRVRILRVTPPVERRVVIDWEAVNRECDEAHASGVYAGPPSAMAQKIIERHATIEEVPNDA